MIINAPKAQAEWDAVNLPVMPRPAAFFMQHRGSDQKLCVAKLCAGHDGTVKAETNATTWLIIVLYASKTLCFQFFGPRLRH